MTVKPKPQDGLVHVGQTVTFTMGFSDKTFAHKIAGKNGVVFEKRLKRIACDESVDIAFEYHVRVVPPYPGIPLTVWCWRCGFEVVR